MKLPRPSELCPICPDCDGQGYSSPDSCTRCSGRGWLPFNTPCGAETREVRRDCIVVHRCTLGAGHAGGHEEYTSLMDGPWGSMRRLETWFRWSTEVKREGS